MIDHDQIRFHLPFPAASRPPLFSIFLTWLLGLAAPAVAACPPVYCWLLLTGFASGRSEEPTVTPVCIIVWFISIPMKTVSFKKQ
jgi:hypothetical protein